ncbi:Hypothetical protein EIN_522890, partial [Entamoeba invadens IP1]
NVWLCCVVSNCPQNI